MISLILKWQPEASVVCRRGWPGLGRGQKARELAQCFPGWSWFATLRTLWGQVACKQYPERAVVWNRRSCCAPP